MIKVKNSNMNIKQNFLLKNVLSAFTSILSLFTLSQPITLSYAVVLSATGVLVSAPLAEADITQRKYIKSAANKYENGNLKEAIEDLNKAIAINPSNQIALTFRGIIRKELKDFEGAISDFTNVIGINPNNDDAYYYRGQAKIFNEGDLNKTVTELRLIYFR